MRRLIPLTLITLMTLTTVLAAPAQAQLPRSNVSAQVYDFSDPSGLPKAYVAIFAPGNPSPTYRADITDNSTVRISPDGRWSAAILPSDASGVGRMTYGLIGGAQQEITTPPNFGIIGPIFSGNSRFLSYTLSAFDSLQWEMIIVDLEVNRRLTFSGTLVFERADLVGAPVLLSLNADGTRAVIAGAGPHGVGTIPFEIDLSNVQFGAPQPLPSLRPLMDKSLLKSQTYYIASEDGLKILYVSADPNRTVSNYIGYGDPFTEVGLVDVTLGQATPLLTAPPDHAIQVVGFLPGETSLYLVANPFRADPSTGVSSPYSPVYLTHDIANNVTTPPTPIFGDPNASVSAFAVCGQTAFFVGYSSVNPNLSTLFSAPVDNLNTPTEMLSGNFSLNFGACVP